VKLAMILRGVIELFDDSASKGLRIPELIKKHYGTVRLPADTTSAAPYAASEAAPQ
jgi:hypothetical protein